MTDAASPQRLGETRRQDGVPKGSAASPQIFEKVRKTATFWRRARCGAKSQGLGGFWPAAHAAFTAAAPTA